MASELDLFAQPELIQHTARHAELDLLERIYDGKQYEGRPDWWTGKHRSGDEEAPLRERKPCIIYRLPKAATQQVVRFLFGDKRFPKISVEVSEQDQNYPAVSEDDASELGSWIAALVECSSLQPTSRAYATKAVACKTAVLVIEVQDGEFQFTLPRPQDCHAEFVDNNPDRPVTRMVWCYEFNKEVADESTGKPTTKRFIFRREWDATNVYVYDDVEVKLGVKLEWGAPQPKAHGLSFCPVVWIRNEPEYSQGLDGRALYEDLEEEFEALDMALSRRHQGIIYLGAPQLVETGVADDDGPDATGRKAGPAGFSGGGTGKHQVAAKARRVAPDSVWTYEGEKVKVELLETSGKAFEVGTHHVNDIRSRLLETMGVVLTSMADTIQRVTTGADMSARFLALAHAPLIALVQEYRHTWWPKGLRRVLSMMLRMTVELTKQDKTIRVPNTEKVAAILDRFLVESEWIEPRMVAHWGKFFDPSSTEIKTNVEAAATAKEKQLISPETAVEFTSHDFGVDDVEAELEEIEDAADEAESRSLATLTRVEGGNRSGIPGATPTVQADSDSGRPGNGQDDAGEPGK
jgi:hypothetical protein